MSFKKIDYVRLIVDYIPYVLRTTINLQWLTALIKPLRTQYGNVIAELKRLRAEAYTTASIIDIEYYLNNYSLASDPVYILDGAYYDDPFIMNFDGTYDETYLFYSSGDTALFGGEYNYIYPNNDTNDTEDHDFKVLMSMNDFLNDETRNNIRKTIDTYKILGSRYLIYKYE